MQAEASAGRQPSRLQIGRVVVEFGWKEGFCEHEIEMGDLKAFVDELWLGLAQQL
jgi:hypothetical protein